MIKDVLTPRLRKCWPSAVLGLLFLFPSPIAYAYSVLSHEAIIDSTWDIGIKPLLLKRFPVATVDELTRAHAYAYGGCIIQDLGYYPFGNRFFSDLTHYVRSGDFVLNMILDSQDLNEYAFALGALSHYAADNNGHPIAVNQSVPLLYPKLRMKFGKLVTYADDPLSHAKTEFAFDVFQAAKGRYAPDAYKNFIGFEVAKPLLGRAFENTYGLKIEKVFLSVDLAIGSYRRSVGTVLPAMTRVAWQLNKQEIRKDSPSATRKTFIYNLSRASYEKNWGSTYTRPGLRSKILAFLIRIVPKVGPFRPLAFKRLTPDTEKFYMASINSTIRRYRELLSEQNLGQLKLPNENLDVGVYTAAGKYRLTDAAYSQLLHKLQDRYPNMPQALRGDILSFYHGYGVTNSIRTNAADWATVVKELQQLQAVDEEFRKTSGAPTAAPVPQVSISVGNEGIPPMSVPMSLEISPSVGIGGSRAAKERMKKQDEEKIRTYDTVSKPAKGLGPGSAGQSGDTQGLSDVAEAGSESVEELVEEGQSFEAEVISGVEDASDDDVAEVHTKQVPEDDVPSEYLEKD